MIIRIKPTSGLISLFVYVKSKIVSKIELWFDNFPSSVGGICWNVVNTTIYSKCNMFYRHFVFVLVNVPGPETVFCHQVFIYFADVAQNSNLRV